MRHLAKLVAGFALVALALVEGGIAMPGGPPWP
jgi:hypothetical protein